MFTNRNMETPMLVVLIALSMVSANLWAEQQKYRFPPLEESTQPNPVGQNAPQPAPVSHANPAARYPHPIAPYPQRVPPNAPNVRRPYPHPYGPMTQAYRSPAMMYPPNRAPMTNMAPPPGYSPNYRAAMPPGALPPPPAGYAPQPGPHPMAGPGPYRGHPAAAWNRGYRPYDNRSFGRKFFDKGPLRNGPFKNGPFGRKSPPWEYDADDNFGFFDMIPSEELEEIWDDMIAGPEDGNIPGPMDWPQIEMPGPFEVGEQAEDVMYEIPSFFGDGYGYDSEDDRRW